MRKKYAEGSGVNYRLDKYGNRISVLGFGCMRFQKKLGQIDLDLAQQQIMAAFERGVNYYDTAYIYPGSEAALGEIFEKTGIRDRIYIATKLPHYLIRSKQGLENLFQEQLKRLRTDHIDYYLMHMLNDVQTWNRMRELGVEDWLEEKKQSGQIRQVGFSYHGNADMFCQLIDAYDWEFCQIQYNYMDEHSQAGRRGLQYAHGKGIPVVIMEPLRGGRLVKNLPEKAEEIFRSHPKGYTPAQWALRWLWDQPEVTCILSGMNTEEMVLDNVQTACDARIGALSEEEKAMLSQVVDAINTRMKVGCTGCGYCMPCPKKVDIPGTFAAYNRMYTEGKLRPMVEYAMCTAFRKDSTAASNCVGCGLCEKHCPQRISIREMLKQASRELENPVYKAARKAVEIFHIF